MLDPEPLIIVGSSARAAAQSAARAGFRPWCVDQFGDRDLAEISDNVSTVTDWPNEIAPAFEESPHANWIYTGALENHPALVERLSRIRPLCGCNFETVSKLRDPMWLADTLTKASLPSLHVVMPASSIPNSDEWIAKPLASAAGIGVRDLANDQTDTHELRNHYLQRKARGRVISGLYLGVEDSSQLIGLCEQLCRGPEAGENRYVYSGSLGPLSVADVSEFAANVFEQAQTIGSAIEAAIRAEDAELNGLFGIDFALDDESGELWTLEINPRYTASTEIYERAFGWPLMKWHVAACRKTGNPTRQRGIGKSHTEQTSPSLTHRVTSSLANGTTSSSKFGKLIVYAGQDFSAPDIVSLIEQLKCRRVRLDAPTNVAVRQDAPYEGTITVSDIPRIGTSIRKDEPVCTLLTEQSNLAECRSVLDSAADALLALIDQACR